MRGNNDKVGPYTYTPEGQRDKETRWLSKPLYYYVPLYCDVLLIAKWASCTPINHGVAHQFVNKPQFQSC